MRIYRDSTSSGDEGHEGTRVILIEGIIDGHHRRTLCDDSHFQFASQSPERLQPIIQALAEVRADVATSLIFQADGYVGKS